jgi:predicted phosphate transport protein (TIGR00153 family)
MLGWLQALMPKEARFFDLFEQHAKIALDAAQALRALLDGGDKVPSLCAEVSRKEDEADAVAREVLLALRRSFITPFDRSDIHGLINDMDDAVDQMRQTVKAINLFDVVSFEPGMSRIGDLIVETAQIALEAMPLLRAMNANSAKLNAASETIVRLEEESDQIYIQGLKVLFQKHKDQNPMSYIVGSEIFGHLEKVVDCFEDVANRISGILLEHM